MLTGFLYYWRRQILNHYTIVTIRALNIPSITIPLNMSNPSLPRTVRSRLARKTVTETIPEVFQASARAKAGVTSVKLLHGPGINKPNIPIDWAKLPPNITVVEDDTLQAAFNLLKGDNVGRDRIAILSMASELRPGGGFLTGANSQEESLCMRTTLYASLRDEFYRLPELGCVYTPDVCVFRGRYDHGTDDGHPSSHVNPVKNWWFTDVISCAAVRGPDGEETGQYSGDEQRDAMREKIKCILRVAVMHGCRRLVLGAFRCGAFGNPSKEVAELFRRALLGRDGTGTGIKGGEFVGCFDKVVFAIKGGRRETFGTFQEVFR